MIDHLRALRLFTRIVELGFSRAAEQLGLNRAAATHSSSSWAPLGVRLLARTAARSRPRWRALRTTSAAWPSWPIWTRPMRSSPRQRGSRRGRIRLDLSAAMFRSVLYAALPEFSARYPQIRLEVSVTDRPIDLVREGVDCVLRAGDLRDVPLVARRLATCPR